MHLYDSETDFKIFLTNLSFSAKYQNENFLALKTQWFLRGFVIAILNRINLFTHRARNIQRWKFIGIQLQRSRKSISLWQSIMAIIYRITIMNLEQIFESWTPKPRCWCCWRHLARVWIFSIMCDSNFEQLIFEIQQPF